MIGAKTTIKNSSGNKNGIGANFKGSSKGTTYIMPKNKHIGHH